jgi:hypothetical protein
MPSGIKGSYKKYNCLYCFSEARSRYGKANKFCTNECQQKYKWENKTKVRIEKGIGPFSAFTLKKYLIEKYGNKCFECNTGDIWQNKPLMLQLEHSDGNSDNNAIDNLKLLCPNCHTQTEFYGSKGKGNRYKKISKRNIYLQEYKKGAVA